MSLLSFSNLSFSFSDVPLFQNLSGHLQPGELVALVGLNGCGKSTLLRLLSGYLPSPTGDIKIAGYDLKNRDAKMRARHIAFVPQQVETDFPFTVEQFVLMGRSPWTGSRGFSKDDFQIVQEALQTWDLQDFSQRLFFSLSGGERQRAVLARAFVQKTKVLLLDEPLNHLDVKMTLTVLNTLKTEARRTGQGMLAVLHQVHLIPEYFDQVWALGAGKFEFQQPVQDISSQQFNDFFRI